MAKHRADLWWRNARSSGNQAALADLCPPFPGYVSYYPSRTHIAPKLRALVDRLRFKATEPRRPCVDGPSQPRTSKRSSIMTLSQTLTKSFTNRACPSLLA